MRSCFTDDVQCHYDKRAPTKGIEAFMGSPQNFNKLQKGAMKITTHFMGNWNVTRIEGDAAETETSAIAFLVEPEKGTDLVAMRSLR